MPNFGIGEIAVILIIALLVVGPAKLPELARGAGKAMRDFRGAISGDDDEDDEPDRKRDGELAISGDDDEDDEPDRKRDGELSS
ncbi:MAG: twin-arginine translocase TatA/TatE family subunit [Thermoleophilaceae bacterium]|nr:twin-arginine translocase TatA/TatE family subunit [Thermoleophilaceae bacterium]